MKTINTLILILTKGWFSFYGRHSKILKILGLVLYVSIIYFIVNLITLTEDEIDNILSNLLSALSIFTALAYGILFIGPEKITESIVLLENRIAKQERHFDDADWNSIIRYANFIKSFNQDIFFVSLMSLVIISLIFIKWLSINEIISQCVIIAIVSCSIILLFFLFKIVATLYRLNQVSISDANTQIKDIAKLYKSDRRIYDNKLFKDTQV